MRLSSQFIFCSRRSKPLCSVNANSITSDEHPVLISISNEETSTKIHIFLSSLQDLTKFKNSFLSSYEKAMREARVEQDKAKAIDSIHSMTQADRDELIVNLQEAKDVK